MSRKDWKHSRYGATGGCWVDRISNRKVLEKVNSIRALIMGIQEEDVL